MKNRESGRQHIKSEDSQSNQEGWNVWIGLNKCELVSNLEQYDYLLTKTMSLTKQGLHQALVVQKVDNAIHQINHYPVGKH